MHQYKQRISWSHVSPRLLAWFFSTTTYTFQLEQFCIQAGRWCKFNLKKTTTAFSRIQCKVTDTLIKHLCEWGCSLHKLLFRFQTNINIFLLFTADMYVYMFSFRLRLGGILSCGTKKMCQENANTNKTVPTLNAVVRMSFCSCHVWL